MDLMNTGKCPHSRISETQLDLVAQKIPTRPADVAATTKWRARRRRRVDGSRGSTVSGFGRALAGGRFFVFGNG